MEEWTPSGRDDSATSESVGDETRQKLPGIVHHQDGSVYYLTCNCKMFWCVVDSASPERHSAVCRCSSRAYSGRRQELSAWLTSTCCPDVTLRPEPLSSDATIFTHCFLSSPGRGTSDKATPPGARAEEEEETVRTTLTLGGRGVGRLDTISDQRVFSMWSRPSRIRHRGCLGEGLRVRREERRPLSSERLRSRSTTPQGPRHGASWDISASGRGVWLNLQLQFRSSWWSSRLGFSSEDDVLCLYLSLIWRQRLNSS